MVWNQCIFCAQNLCVYFESLFFKNQLLQIKKRFAAGLIYLEAMYQGFVLVLDCDPFLWRLFTQ